MCFANRTGGLNSNLDAFGGNDSIRLLFSEQPAIVIQVRNNSRVEQILKDNEISYYPLGQPTAGRELVISQGDEVNTLDINELRDVWYRTSYLLDRKQCGDQMAAERYRNYKNQPLTFTFAPSFTGKFADYGIIPNRRVPSGIKAAIIREKGVNGDREMAYAMYLAGMDVKDVHMTDLIAGRETLEDISMIVFVGGFSNSDVLGSAKGWAGAFLYNPKARLALERFYSRPDTLSLGICNGCQVMMELDLVYPDRKNHPKMHLNTSGKFESGFISLEILPNESVMLKSLAGSRLGVWVAHAEGKFVFSDSLENYNAPAKFAYSGYPGNPNGSPGDIAALCSDNGRHLVMMPHLERAFLPWQWPYYPTERRQDEVAPWIEAFVNARNWIKTC